MALDLRFAFVCQKKWQDLTGNGPVTRHCDSCDRTIFNLDAISDEEREKLFRKAIVTGTDLCVIATVNAEGGKPCEGAEVVRFDDDLPMVAGMLELDDVELDPADDEEDAEWGP